MDRMCLQVHCDNPIFWKKAFCTGCLHRNLQQWKCENPECNTLLDSANNSVLKRKCNSCSKESNLMRQRRIRRNGPRTRGYIKHGIYKGFHKVRHLKGSSIGMYEKRLMFFEKHPELIGLKRLITINES